jgi:mycothiol synthase
VAEFTVRPARAEDTPAAFQLLADWQKTNYGEVEIGSEMFTTVVNSADAAFVAEAEGRVVGHTDVDGGWIGLIVDPDMRRRGVGSALLEAAEREAATHPTLLMGLQSDPSAAPFATASGYEKAWEVWLMGIDLPDQIPDPQWPEGVSVRTYGGDEAEAREIKDLLDLAYAEEFHHHPATFENWSRFMFDDPMFDAGVWFLAVTDEKIVGAALNWDEGYIKDLVVHPEWRGRGLGKALVHQTFGEFKRRGVPRVTLKTDSNNPTDAWRLYERVGMRKERTYEIFQKGSAAPSSA